jgi:DNA-binding NarL/FixJ family response regulator
LYKEKERKSGEQLLDKFTPREKEILNLICKGLNNEQIAELIHLSPKTVEKHKSNLFQKTETFNTVNLVIYAFKNQLISL